MLEYLRYYMYNDNVYFYIKWEEYIMKRLLSVLLAIIMVATLLPVGQVFAEEGEEENTGIVIKYDILGAVTKLGASWESGDSTSKKPFTMLNWDFTDGFFNFADSSGVDGIYTNHSSINYSPKVGIQLASGNRFALEIYVPKAGTYDMKMFYGNSKNYAQTSVYVNKDAVSYETSDMVGAYECRVEGTIDKEANRTDPSQIIQLNHTFEAVVEDIEFDEAGTYFVSFRSNGSYGSVGTFYLIEDGTGTANPIVSLETSIDNSSLTLDGEGEAQMSIDSIYLGDGNVASDISAYTVEYTSSNDDVAKVDNTGKITAVGAGEAKITATVTDSFGAMVASTQKVVVSEYGYILEYNIARMRNRKFVNEWKAENYNAADEAGKTSLIKGGEYSNISYENTFGFFKYAGTNANTPTAGYKVSDTETLHLTDAYYPGCGIRLYDNSLQIQAGKYMAFELNVPVAGEYDVEIIYWTSTNTLYNRDAEVYISQDGVSTDASDLVGTFNVYNKTENVQRIAAYNFDKPGKYTFTIKTTGSGSYHTLFSGIILKNGGSNAIIGELSADKDEINASEKETATVTASGYLSATAYDTFTKIGQTDPTAATGFTYSSSNEKIATVDAVTGVVTPVSEGVVTIFATTPNAKNALSTDITVTVNKPGEAVADTVKVYVDATTGGTVTADKVAVKTIADAKTGETITATATAADGYKFAYWKDSAGNVVSESETYTFRAFTNTSIIAVFDNVSEENTTNGVEFFDGNRDYLGFVSAEKGTAFESITAPTANLTGYKFTGWSIADNAIINGVLRAVALYEEEGNAVSGIKVNGAAKAGTKYDDEITETVEGAKAWYRDDKLVGYGKSYTYYVWGETAITSSTEDVDEKLPIAVLNTNGDAYMLEYDAAGYEIVDAGILFGDETHNTVNACYYKAKVKNIKAHGQFTAKKSADTTYAQTKVRGYVMFRDGDSVRVIYAD